MTYLTDKQNITMMHLDEKRFKQENPFFYSDKLNISRLISLLCS